MLLEVKCISCGKDFNVNNCKVRIGQGKFCSSICYWKSMKGKIGIKRGYNINCLSCFKLFYISKCLLGKKKFCCKQCHIKFQTTLTGEKSQKWQGSNVGYIGIHSWLRKTFRESSNCEKCGKGNCRLEWALLKGKAYERKRENFWRLCCSCHRNYDMDEEWKKNLSLSHKNLPFKSTNVQFINK